MTTVHIPVDLGSEAADSIEFLAEVIERELNRLDALEADALPPGAARDDPDFQQFRRQIHASLLALRGLGLHLTDEQARQCRHLWAAAFALTSADLDAYPRPWYGAVHCLDGVLPHVEAAEG